MENSYLEMEASIGYHLNDKGETYLTAEIEFANAGNTSVKKKKRKGFLNVKSQILHLTHDPSGFLGDLTYHFYENL